MTDNDITRWLTYVKLILKKGSVWIKPFDYSAHIDQLWKNNTEAKKLNINFEVPNKSWKHYILYLPILGPLTALVSHYKQQKKWPTYIYHWPEKKLAYVRISKSAGTSIQAAILQKQHPDLDTSKLTINQINEMGKAYIKPFLEPGYECFTLIRNPYDRLLSCYFDQVVGREKRFYFDDYSFRVIRKGMSFHDFVNTIMYIPDAVKDLHFRPQYNYISGIKGIRYFRLEEDVDSLNEYLNKFDLVLDNHNKNNVKFNKREYYSPEIKSVVDDIYKEDFRHFDYNTDEL